MEKVFDFIAKEIDFLGRENADKEIAAIVRVAKEKNKEEAEGEVKVFVFFFNCNTFIANLVIIRLS